MIISKTPFRISFFGGGTDYPVWIKDHGGAVLGTTIDKYAYITCRFLPPFFKHKYRIVYSQMENVKSINDIDHPFVRECIRFSKIHSELEIHHDSDLPARSGLGSSSTFTVGLLNCLNSLKGEYSSKEKLAKDAIHVEQNLIVENVGCQDQIHAAFGGLNHIEFFQDGSFNVDDFEKAIKRFNLPYNKDDLLLSLYLYTLDRKTKNIDKNDPELKNISKLCRIRFKTMGFHQVKDFIPDKYAEKFRNENGIHTKIHNFKFTDPNVEGGYPGGAHGPQKKIWNLYFKNNQINKKQLSKDSKDLIQRILSKDIEILIGKTDILKNKNKKQNKINDIFSESNFSPEILSLDFEKKYKNRIVNPDNFSDKIEALNLIDKSNEIHEKTVNELAQIFNNKKLPTKNTKHIDFYSEYENRGKLFEIKTFNNSNFNQQIRHGIIQLREYYFAYSQYWKKIPINTDLFLLLDKNPEKKIKDIQLDFLKDQKIKICWIKDKNVVSFDNKILF